MSIASAGHAMVRDPQRERRTDGFTLTELMVVVAIISVTAALAAPSIGAAFADRRSSEAALDLVRVTRRARTEANAYGRAYMMRITPDTPGRISVFRGTNPRCNSIPWDLVVAAGDSCAENRYCVDEVHMGRYSSGLFEGASGGVIVNVSAEGFGGIVEMCFEPSGRSRWRNGTAGRFLDTNTGGLQGGVLVNFARTRDGAPDGVTRRVVIPLGADARVLR